MLPFASHRSRARYRGAQVDKDLLRFRSAALRLGESEFGTPDSDDGVVDRCLPFPPPCPYPYPFPHFQF